jgi:exosortase A-associated hydrolase 2
MSPEDDVEVSPSFAQTARGAQFRITFRARHDRPMRGRVVFVHPFAEEMNKSRRMVALGARRLAGAGFEVVLFDLHGCGDSAGELCNATWQGWVEEVRTVLAESPDSLAGGTWLWGLRAGALLATAAIDGGKARPNLLLWQPVLSGNQHLQQFLRLESAAAMIRGDAHLRGTNLRELLASGESVEVAGYEIGAELARGMDASRLRLPSGYPGNVVWLEVSPTQPAELLPVSAQRVHEWRIAGASVFAAAHHGLPFWQTQEIAECPALLEATVEAVCAADAGR